jgi:hypothetical protein
MRDRKDLYFLVEGGTVLELAKAHVAAANETHERNCALAKELGVTSFCASHIDGRISGVVFEGERHKDFAKPNKYGACHPKKKTEWLRRFEESKGYDKRGYGIAEALGIPTSIEYTYDDGRGWTAIAGGIHSGVGFLWLSGDGPYALYLPDVAAAVTAHEERGHTVSDDAKNFKPAFDGARPILKEEWELIVAQHKVAKLKEDQA